MPRIRLLALAFAGLAAAACLEGAPFEPRIEDVNFATELGVNLTQSVRTSSGLYYRDITVGTGPQVRTTESGDSVSVRYEGFLRNAYKFDDNLTSPTPLRFVTGDGLVIDGFDEGVRGMQANGVRQIIVPPDLAYGNRVSGNIPANSILVFTVTLTRVAIPAPTP